MNPTPEAPSQSPSKQEVEQMIDLMTLASDDQFNRNLMLTVQAVQHLHIALDGKFTQ